MNKRKISGLWMSLVGILLSVLCSNAENKLTFQRGKILTAGITMPYRYAQTTGTGVPSLVIYLHGGSSKGSDNEIQMKEAGIDSIANYLELRKINAVFLVPQCPSDKSWGGVMLGVLKSLIDKYIGERIVDVSNIYIFGGSMGGTGTWSMLSAYPGLFAAAMPVAGNPSKCDADKVALTPIYTVMGTADKIMSVESASNFVSELNVRNGITRFDIEDGWTHEMTCIQSYTTNRLDWVFNKGYDSAENIAVDDEIIESVQYFSIDGRLLPEPPNKGLYIMKCVMADGTMIAKKMLH